MTNLLDNMDKINQKIAVSTVEIITPQMARHLRDTAHFERQRNIINANVKRLAAEMKAGRFTVGTQIYICVLPDGSQLIVNGNHTLEAVVEAGIPQVLTMTRLPVKDHDEAGCIYAVFDIQKVRSWRDSIRAVGADEGLQDAAKVLAAVGLISTNFNYNLAGGSSRLERIATIEDYRREAELFQDALIGCPRENTRLLRRSGCMAVALITLKYQPSFAMDFWQKIARDDGLRVGMPERALLFYLRNNKGSGSDFMRLTAKAAAAGWNAAWKGEERNYVKPCSMANLFILGTPWTKD